MTQSTEPKVSYLARSPRGQAMIAFDNLTAAQKWKDEHPAHSGKIYKQTITEEEIKL